MSSQSSVAGRNVRDLLRARQSLVIHVPGGDSTSTDTYELLGALGYKLRSLYPEYSLLWHAWNDTTQSWPDVPTTLATGAPDSSPRGLRFPEYTSLRFASSRVLTGNVDARVRFATPEPVAANGSIDLIGRAPVAGQRQFSFGLNFAGRLRYKWSIDGTAETEVTSTVNPALAANVPLWVRVTHVLNNGAAGHTVTFYTSTDGTNWTVLGAPVVTAGVIASLFQSTGQFFSGYFNPSSRTTATIHWLDVRNGIDGQERMVPPLAESWSILSGNVNLTPVGAPVIYLVNGSVAGQTVQYFDDATRRPRVSWPSGADVLLLNLGHNQGSALGEANTAAYASLVTNVRAAFPYSPLVVLDQNPIEAGGAIPAAAVFMRRRRRVQLYRWASTLSGVESVDTAAKWPTGNAVQLGLLESDGLHPTAMGADLQADAIVDYLM